MIIIVDEFILEPVALIIHCFLGIILLYFLLSVVHEGRLRLDLRLMEDGLLVDGCGVPAEFLENCCGDELILLALLVLEGPYLLHGSLQLIRLDKNDIGGWGGVVHVDVGVAAAAG